MFYAADGNGDNYDVVNFLLDKFTASESITCTKALLYFLNKESSKYPKSHSIKEIFKRVDLIDFSIIEKNGEYSMRNIHNLIIDTKLLKEIVNKANEIGNWQGVINKIAQINPDVWKPAHKHHLSENTNSDKKVKPLEAQEERK